MEPDCITVLLADDNVFVGEGVRALLEREADLKVVDAAGAYDEFIAGAEAAAVNLLAFVPGLIAALLRPAAVLRRE